jgi:hypothetical protein
VKPAVSGLAEEYGGRVRGENVDATTAEAKQAVKDLGFSLHGIVVRGPDGTVLFKQADHTVEIEAVRENLSQHVAP